MIEKGNILMNHSQPTPFQSNRDKKAISITGFDLQRLRNMMIRYKNIISFCDQQSIDKLCQKLLHASVFDSKDIPPDVVTMNSTFSLRGKDEKELSVFTLVFPEKENFSENKISVLSPLGSSLLGSVINDVIDHPVPAGIQKLVLEKIIYQPERSGDYHL